MQRQKRNTVKLGYIFQNCCMCWVTFKQTLHKASVSERDSGLSTEKDNAFQSVSLNFCKSWFANGVGDFQISPQSISYKNNAIVFIHR